jgi:3',5'-cyclic AMP phosphodiesterase CpdA
VRESGGGELIPQPVQHRSSAGDSAGSAGRILAISDLHVSYRENRDLVSTLQPVTPDDWLIVAGDVAERAGDVVRTLERLASRFATVVWTPGNHELWTHPDDPVRLRGEDRYRHLVDRLRELGVVTPEDPFPVWEGPGGPVAVAPLFLLFDYSFLPAGANSVTEGLAIARARGIVCTDETLLHPDPYPSRQAWCVARVEATTARLDAHDPALPLVLVNHFPLVREPTRVLWFPEFAQWCGTTLTAHWHRRYPVHVVVYGHLHIPRTTWYDGVRFEEVSMGYPREWAGRATPPAPRQILPLASGHPE